MLYEKLKKDRIQAMKDKETVKKDLLSTLIGDLDKGLKVVDGVKNPPTDSEVIAVTKKFINNLEITIKEMLRAGKEPIKENREINILKDYLPKQLSEAGLEAAIKYAVGLGSNKIGDIMKYLKENYDGRYDGKLASELIKKALA